ncbi:MAG: hypothetical protein LPK12_06595 [Rhodobacterales bacterium]|nr:hypothetical protein [Rhodobacterales bacterium]MDX5499655.1 hypothetical protein [Rhodobacterales bacterium]
METGLDRGPMCEALSARAAVEPMMARLAAPNCTAPETALLEVLHGARGETPDNMARHRRQKP